MRQRTRNNWSGIRKEQKVLRQPWDKKEEEGGRSAGCREEQPWFLYPETRNNSPPFPPLSHLYSLPSISLPLGSPSASYHGNRRRGRKKNQREMRSVPKEELSQLKNSKFRPRRGADLLHRLRARLCWLSQSLMLVYSKAKAAEELNNKLNQRAQAKHTAAFEKPLGWLFSEEKQVIGLPIREKMWVDTAGVFFPPKWNALQTEN